MSGVSRDLKGNPIYPRSMFRCCIESLKQYAPKDLVGVTQVFKCPVCKDLNYLQDGMWKWSKQA